MLVAKIILSNEPGNFRHPVELTEWYPKSALGTDWMSWAGNAERRTCLATLEAPLVNSSRATIFGACVAGYTCASSFVFVFERGRKNLPVPGAATFFAPSKTCSPRKNVASTLYGNCIPS